MKEDLSQVEHFQKRLPKLVKEITLLDEVLSDSGGTFTNEEMGVIFTDMRLPQNPDTEKAIINTQGMKKVAHLMDIRIRNTGINPDAQVVLYEREHTA